MQKITRRRLLAGAAAAPLLWVPRRVCALGISTAARPVYPCRVMLIGQSLAQLVDYTSEGYNLATTVVSGAVSPTVSSVEIINEAAGGSVSCIQNDPTAGSNYWVNDPSGTPSDGPLLTAALAEITARLAITPPNGPIPPTCIMFDQGQADVRAAAGLIGGVTPAQGIANFTNAWIYAFGRIQTTLGGSGPVPIYIVLLGRQDGSTSAIGGYDGIRKAQIQSLLAIANTVRVADDYDMGLFNGPHPDRNYQPLYGQRIGLAMIKHQYGASPLWTGPTITSITQPSATEVEVHIAIETGDTIDIPTSALGPWGFAFYDGSTRLGATFEKWSGNNPIFTLSAAPAALAMNFIDDYGPNFNDPADLIVGTTSRLPLQMNYL